MHAELNVWIRLTAKNSCSSSRTNCCLQKTWRADVSRPLSIQLQRVHSLEYVLRPVSYNQYPHSALINYFVNGRYKYYADIGDFTLDNGNINTAENTKSENISTSYDRGYIIWLKVFNFNLKKATIKIIWNHINNLCSLEVKSQSTSDSTSV